MKLRDYLKLIDKRPYQWAMDVGLPISSVWRAFKNIGFPSHETIKSIEKASNGAVRPEDWYD